MKAQIPQPERYSYQLHRKQRVTQIFLPVMLSAILLVGMVVLISLATFKSNGDVGRWAAISAMWVAVPILLAGLILLAVLIGLIYLMTLALKNLPRYTGVAQDYVYLARGYVMRGADMVANPVIALKSSLENITAFVQRMINP